MADTSIEWTDKTWNPVTGCTRASTGCDNCYAVTMTKRLEAMGQEKYSGLVNIGKGHFNGVVKCHEDALLLPLSWKKPQRVFVNSMSDLFHPGVPFEFIDKVFAVMALCPHLTFQVLTKRPQRMVQYFATPGPITGAFAGGARGFDCEEALPASYKVFWDWFEKAGLRCPELSYPYPNVWLGTSVEDQKAADERIPHLLKCPAAVRFLSCEPLLGSVSLDVMNFGAEFDAEGASYYNALKGKAFEADGEPGSWGPKIDWVICGGESGHGARPMSPDWARSLRDQCQAANVSFFFKQWGEWVPDDGRCAEPGSTVPSSVPLEYPFAEWDSEEKVFFGDLTAMLKIGKHRAGRVIDDRTWNEFPAVKA